VRRCFVALDVNMSDEEINREIIKRLFSEAEWALLAMNEQFNAALKQAETSDDTAHLVKLGLDVIERARIGRL